jgi:hypothetical protein
VTRLKLLRSQDGEEQINNEPNRNDTHNEIFHDADLLKFSAGPGEQYENEEREDRYSYIDNIIHNRLVHRIISRRHTAVGQLADLQGANDEHI